MKKALSLTLAAIMLAWMAIAAVFAETSGDFEYEVSDGEVKITRYLGAAESVTIPATIGTNPVTSIGYNAFGTCLSLKNVTIPNGVKEIEASAFFSCDSLISITIPGSLKWIGDGAFRFSSLQTIFYSGTRDQWNELSVGHYNYDFETAEVIFINEPEPEPGPDERDENWEYLVKNGEATITGYTGSASAVTIPRTIGGYPVIMIGDFAFSGCTSLTSVTIPNGVTTIGERAFSDCLLLTSISFPKSVTRISEQAFIYTSLTSINVDPDNSYYKSIDGVLYTKDGKTLVSCPTKKTSVTIPNGVKEIGNWAFSLCEMLTKVTFPNSLKKIGNMAFWHCASLTSITLPRSLTTIDENAFAECLSLERVTIPDSVTKISGGTFSLCYSLESVTIPVGVTEIGNGAFLCHSLTTVYYGGSSNDWNRIEIGDSNDDLLSAQRVYYFGSPEPETTESVNVPETTEPVDEPETGGEETKSAKTKKSDKDYDDGDEKTTGEHNTDLTAVIIAICAVGGVLTAAVVVLIIVISKKKKKD